MTYKQISEIIQSIGIPYAYYQFPNDTEQPTPFICFFYPNNNDFIADNANYQKIEHLIIELYTDNKDFELEAAVEAALSSNGMVYARSEDEIESERMHITVYETDVLITKEN